MSQSEDRQQIIYLKRNVVTVEPVAILALSSNALSSAAARFIALDKVCRVKLGLDGRICNNIQKENSRSDYLDKVQDYYFIHSIWENVLKCLLPCILLLFIGGWSDRTGRRRIILLFPVIGRSLQILSLFISAMLLFEIPLEVHIFLNTFFSNIFGGTSLMIFALFVYVLVTSSDSNRLYRLGAISVCSITGTSLGVTISREIIKNFSYLPILALSIVMNAMTSLYIIYKVSDPKRSNEQKRFNTQSAKGFLKIFFTTASIEETAEVISKKTTNNREFRLCVQILTMIILFSMSVGETTVFEPIAINNYGWNQSMLNTHRMLDLTLSTIGLLVILLVLTKKLKCHDSVIGIVSLVSRIASSLYYCFFPRYALFIGPVVGIFDGSAILAVMSLCSKMLEHNELGKVTAFVLLVGNLVRLVYMPLYLFLYAKTRDTLPGAVFLVVTAYSLPVLFVFIWLLYDHRRETTT